MCLAAVVLPFEMRKRQKPVQHVRQEDSELASESLAQLTAISGLESRLAFIRSRAEFARTEHAAAIALLKNDCDAAIGEKDAAIALLKKEHAAAIALCEKDNDEMLLNQYRVGGAVRYRSSVISPRHRSEWANALRTHLRATFPGQPEQAHCALSTLAGEDLSTKHLSDLLELRKEDLCAESEFLDDAVRKGQLEYRDYLQKHIGPPTGENLIKTMLLSRVKYQRLNEQLFCKHAIDDDGTPVYVLRSFNGVQAPHLPTRHALDKYRKQILAAFELEKGDEGLSATVSLREVLKNDILASIRQGYFTIIDGQVKQWDGRAVQVMKYTDTANHFKGMKVTASAVQLPDGSCAPNSPFHTSLYAVMEASDGWEDMTTYGRSEVEQVNNLIADPNLKLEPILVQDPTGPGQVEISVSCPIEFNFGGDQAHSNAMNCLGGCNCACPCPYCECSKHDLCSLDFEKEYEPRTRGRIMLLAHAELGKCPGCLRKIVPKGEVVNAEEEVELAVDGDEDPEVPYRMKAKQTTTRPVTHATLHFGVVLGRSPPYHLDPDQWIVCLLHLNLCIVRGLFTRTIVAEFGKIPRNTGPDALSFAKQVDAMATMLSAAGLRMKKNKLHKATSSKEVSHYDERLKNSGLGGKDAEFMMNARNAMLQLMYPESKCGPWYPDEIMFDSQESFAYFYDEASKQTTFSSVAMQKCYDVRRLWRQWDRTWQLLRSKMDYGPGGISALTRTQVQDVWNKRADKVYEHATTFVGYWVKAVQATQGVYLHMIVRHVPGQIRKFGDMNTRQTQGLEHCHHDLKEVGMHATNKKQGQRMPTMLTHQLLKTASMQDDEVAMRISKTTQEAAYKKDYGTRALAKYMRKEAVRLKLEESSDLLITPAVESAAEQS
jgi:hypothetical protein